MEGGEEVGGATTVAEDGALGAEVGTQGGGGLGKVSEGGEKRRREAGPWGLATRLRGRERGSFGVEFWSTSMVGGRGELGF